MLDLIPQILAADPAAAGEAAVYTLGHGLKAGLGCFGAAIGVGLVGMKAAEAVGRNPGAATPILVQGIIGMALAEAVAFYALFLANSV